ncbi:hypothetical protein LEP1GSC150_5446 [Leptospira interrogans serovar Copenhageni str. LT2050]|uniref:Uncharacterized protein n=1 Tax=Leptospira interrogans serovar Copenhageni str. LT2050 TaxID=1001598 RepID=M3IRE9_LEPIT|nr:hypothetical protein LEP1GSC150_5446 [Leptospira interrogans serovar Copenhageni str. LT2050]
MLSPSASFILGERNGKSRSQVCRSRLWKKSIEVVRINSENSLERRQFSTTESGINNLLQWLTLNGNLAHHKSLDWISIF